MPTLTFDPIASTTISSGSVSTITFSSIPSTFTDLRVLLFARQGDGSAGSSSSGSGLRLNGDSGSNYGACYAGANPGGQYAGAFAGDYVYYGETAQDGNTSGVFTANWIDIPNYRNTNCWQQVLGQSYSPNTARSGGAYGGYMFWNANVRRNTEAITSITIWCGAPSTATVYEIGSMATLYGIKAE
jgi:hypothetical protein